jgi:hypothetical protein
MILAPTASAPDLGDGSAQFGRERAELVAAAVAVACLARSLQAVGGGAETDRTYRLRCTLEPVGGRRQTGEVGGAPSQVDLLLGFDRAVAKLRQQFLDAGMVVAEPGGQYAAVDRSAAKRRLACRRAIANR